ncbi:MAG: hypothetical protein AB7E32_14735 [Desulfovibrio sp.]
MATTICLEVSVGVDVSPAAFERWVASQLNMLGIVPDATMSPELLALEKDIDAIDEFEGEIFVQRIEPMTLELCSTEVKS